MSGRTDADMEELKGELRSLREEIGALREEVDRLRRILFVLSTTTALAKGDHSITHRYLRRLIEQVEGTSRDKLEEEALLNRNFAEPLEQALDLMADRAQEMNLSELAGWLER
jgi:hypothetical protein